MDKPDAKKPKSIPTDQAGPSAKPAPPKPPGLTEENPNPSGQEHPVTSKPWKDSPPPTPSKKRKLEFSCFGKRSPKKAAEGSVKKEEPQEDEDLPKRERFSPPPHEIAESLEENPPPPPSPASFIENVIATMRQMSIKRVRNRIRIIKESFMGEHPVNIYTEPSCFKLAEVTEDEVTEDEVTEDAVTEETDDEVGKLSPFFGIACSITHNRMIGIHEPQYFELSVQKIPKDKNILKKLGFCVKFTNSNCTLPDNKCKQCDVIACQVCPHQFECNCSEKFVSVNWCSHLHLAKRVELQKYEGQACLFVSPTRNHLTADRHLRAFVQGDTKMKEVAPDLYEEQFEFLKRSQLFKVTKKKNQQICKCPSSKICKRCEACFCQWVCTCPDYWLYDQVCEHLHLVAMKRHPQSKKLFKTLGDYGEGDVFECPLLDRGIDVEVEHENSFYINKKVDVVDNKAGGWNVASFAPHLRPKNGKVTFLVTKESRENLCICGMPEKAKPSQYCIRCKICIYHYRCTCEGSTPNFICHHVHAVVRKDTPQLSETVKQRRKHLEDIEKRYYEILDINLHNELIERKAEGPLPGHKIAPESLSVSGETDFPADDSESDKVDPKAVKDESANDPAQKPMNTSKATGSLSTIYESDEASSSEAVKDESANEPARKPLDESIATSSQATIDESDEASSSEAVKDESANEPSWELLDESTATRSQATIDESDEASSSEAVRDESANEPSWEPLDESTATRSQATIDESDEASSSEAVKDESANEPTWEPMDESPTTSSQASIDESDKAAPSEAVKDESDPSQQPTDK